VLVGPCEAVDKHDIAVQKQPSDKSMLVGTMQMPIDVPKLAHSDSTASVIDYKLSGSSNSSEALFSAQVPKHPLEEKAPRAVASMRFIRVDVLTTLEAPIPRCQDLTDDCFGVMRACDKLIAISHGWRFQMHPDPYGVEIQPMTELLQALQDVYRDSGVELYAFLDYTAIPQRPFRLSQAERTEEEQDIFQEALLHLDAVFLHADHFVHLDVPVELPADEGEVYRQSSVQSSSFELRQVGPNLQCVLPFPFDNLLAVNGEKVSSALTADRLLAQSPLAEVTLERHRYGLPNVVDCSDRGWIYLERFITMVVVAMLKEENFEDTVTTNSVETFQEIHAGAQFLRQAAQKDARFQRSSAVFANSGSKAPSALQQAFAEFEDCLKVKRFSAASVDKSLNPALRAVSTLAGARDSSSEEDEEALLPSPSDVEIVTQSMCSLVRHLALHWESEQEFRQARSRLAQKVEDYVLVWNCFSPGFMQRVQEQMRLDPMLVVLFVFVPVVCSSGVCLLPYARPDAGLEANWLHFIGFALECWLSLLPVPRIVGMFMQAELSYLCTMLWPLIAGVLPAILLLVLVMLTGTYPMPFAPVIAGPLGYCMSMPLLWLFIPQEVYSNPRAKKGFQFAVFAGVSAASIFYLCYPMLNVWLQSNDGLAHCIIVAFTFLGARWAFESMQICTMSIVGADFHPFIVWSSEVFYQVALCDFFKSVQYWQMILVFIGVDLAENLYYLYCFHVQTRSRRAKRQRAQHGVAQTCTGEMIGVKCSSTSENILESSSAVARNQSSVTVMQRRSSTNSSLSVQTQLSDGIAVCVASSMLLRATADLLVPMQFLMILGVLRCSPSAQYNNWASAGQLARTSGYLVSSALVELLFFTVACYILHYRGMRPLQLLRGVIAASNIAVFVMCMTMALIWYTALQLVHNGCDFHFNFEWVHGSSVWVTAHQWADALP